LIVVKRGCRHAANVCAMTIYRHLLLPIDATALSHEAAVEGVRFARCLGARVTALHVTPVFRPSSMHAHAVLREVSEADVESKTAARQALREVVKLARDAGVECEIAHRVSDHPAEAIVAAADELGCDVVFMASHGCGGMRALLWQSAARNVVAHAKVPVLVWTAAASA
jgi:nucleotide-binding universal stress UspA family protein